MKTCKVPDCFDPVVARELCRKHYMRNYRGQSLEPMPRYRPKRRRAAAFFRKSTG